MKAKIEVKFSEEQNGIKSCVKVFIPCDEEGNLEKRYISDTRSLLDEDLGPKWGALSGRYRTRMEVLHFANGIDAEIKTKFFVKDAEAILYSVVEENEMRKYVPKDFSVVIEDPKGENTKSKGGKDEY